MTRDYWGEPSGEPRPDYRDAVEPDVPIEHEGKPALGERSFRVEAYEALSMGHASDVDAVDLLGAFQRSIEKARALRRAQADAWMTEGRTDDED